MARHIAYEQVTSDGALRKIRATVRRMLTRPNPKKQQLMRTQLGDIEKRQAQERKTFTETFDTKGPEGFNSSTYRATEIPDSVLDEWARKLTSSEWKTYETILAKERAGLFP